MNREEIGNIIKNGRKEKGLTQQELAKKVHITDKAVSNWETGKNIPDKELLERIEKVLDIKLTDKIITKKQRTIKLLKEVCIFIIITLLIIFGIYTINNYNSINIYSLSVDQHLDIYDMNNSTISIINNQTILSINNIKNNDLPPYNFDYKITIYTNDNDKKNIIYESINNQSNKVILDYKLSKKDLNNLYLDISYLNINDYDKKATYKLNVRRVISSNHLFKKDIIKENEIKISNRTLSLLQNNGYKKISDYEYKKEYNEGYYLFNVTNNTLYYKYINNNKEYYAARGQYVTYYIVKKDNVITSYKLRHRTQEKKEDADFVEEKMDEYLKLVD